VQADEFQMGSPESEPGFSPTDFQLRVRIGRTFAISAYEVTKAQYRTFRQAVKGINPAKDPLAQYSDLRDDSAQIGINWYDAVHYCDWLSEQENIPRDQWCYDPKNGVYGPKMKAKDKFWELQGYRLPTEAEWEFACRAGTVTSRYYGVSDQLLPHYARFLANSRNRPSCVGTLEPNDWGLFDMLGNVGEMCFDLANDRRKGPDTVVEDAPMVAPIEATRSRVVRGGAFNSGPELVGSGRRADHGAPSPRTSATGFRPARTYGRVPNVRITGSSNIHSESSPAR
jgi:hypothetical protein